MASREENGRSQLHVEQFSCSSRVACSTNERVGAEQGSGVRGRGQGGSLMNLWGRVRSLAVVKGLDVLRGEVAHMSMAAAPPAQRIGAVNEFNDVAAQEA